MRLWVKGPGPRGLAFEGLEEQAIGFLDIIVDSPYVVAHALKDILIKSSLLSEEKPQYHFYVSDITKNFQKLAKKFFGKEIILELKTLH